ncbi:unnamed protein product [Didymodactylos carnosus]|uniref:Uridine kinase n=1 Tax=Didymodactylos carnosus TaxID=1234261 RepID=A0A814NS74_9BILA|nr:unnamed protein product [Didymodactylos carnosus]CAF1095775.1 unnamed protein product [Didymodactylos carnosus]CAF3713611.1 unnamed protein product [Didymodactylos carnosus]CAF3861117.1 unnamed protein product [Didymodactylos carnosus]
MVPPISDNDDEIFQDSRSIELSNSSQYSRTVSFKNTRRSSSAGKAATARLRRQRTTSRSKEDRVFYNNRNPIYTAGKQSRKLYSRCIIYTSLIYRGRPPWYDVSGETKEAFVIGICGGSASGKTTVAKRIVEKLNVPWVSLLSMDSFYKVLSDEQHQQANENNYNFDHPDAFDFNRLLETLKNLKNGKQVEIPLYNFQTHSRENYTKTLYGANVVIFEGIMAFASKEIRELLDMKVFVDTDADIRLARRLERDITERGREIDGVIQQYTRFVKPSYDNFIAPTMIYADLIVPRGGENKIAIDLIVNHVNRELQKRGLKVRSEIAHRFEFLKELPMPQSFYLLEQTLQTKYLHTIIRNHKTGRDEFIFYSNRLMRLCTEYALTLLPFEDVTVETQQGLSYQGKKHVNARVCGVSIVRAGECLEPALIEVYKDVKIGKILIQTNQLTGEPELHYLRLPRDISDSYVFILDATVATGAAAMMAIRVLLDHNVDEEKIALLSLLVSKQGVQTIGYAFNKVKIIATACDEHLDAQYFICPGLGNFGDRYFGTDNTNNSKNESNENSLRKFSEFHPSDDVSPPPTAPVLEFDQEDSRL